MTQTHDPRPRFTVVRVSDRDVHGQPSRHSFHYNMWDREVDDFIAIEHQATALPALRALAHFLNAHCPPHERPAAFLRRLLDSENWTAQTERTPPRT